MEISKKITLYQLRLQYGLNIYDLSRAAQTSSYAVWSMMTGKAVTPQEAQQVLDGLNALVEAHYTLADVDVVLHENNQNLPDENEGS